jgi:hypothetical protein
VARIFKFITLALVAAVAGALTTVALHTSIMPSNLANNDLNYSDFLSITLTALGLMITVLGFFVAAAGVIGWTTLESKLRSHSIEYFQEQLQKDSKLRTELEEIIAQVGYAGIENFKAQQGMNDTIEETKARPASPEEEYND